MFVKYPRELDYRLVRLRCSLPGYMEVLVRFIGQYYLKEREIVLAKEARVRFLKNGNMMIYRNNQIVSLQFEKGTWEYFPGRGSLFHGSPPKT